MYDDWWGLSYIERAPVGYFQMKFDCSTNLAKHGGVLKFGLRMKIILAINFSSAQLNLSLSRPFWTFSSVAFLNFLDCTKLAFVGNNFCRIPHNFIRVSFLNYHYIATFIYFNSEKTHCNDFLYCRIESLINGLVISAIAVILTNFINQSRDYILSLEYFCPSKRPYTCLRKQFWIHSGWWGHRLPRFQWTS